MNGYTKLFGSILASSVWSETKETKIVWITMLAMADKNGNVAGSVPGLAQMARLTLAETQEALATLAGPDPHSRTPAFEGRRIKVIDGGWKIINHSKYRNAKREDERREYLREKQREHRLKKKAAAAGVNDVNNGQQASTTVNNCQPRSTARTRGQQHEVDSGGNQADSSDLEPEPVNNRQQKSTSQHQAKGTTGPEANINTTGCSARLPKCGDSGNPEAEPPPFNLALLDWGSAVRYAEAASRRVPARNEKERRQWLKYGARAGGMFGVGWLVGAGEAVVNSTAGPRTTKHAQFVGILKISAFADFGIDEAAFAKIRKFIEIPDDVWNSDVLGGPRKKALARSA